MNYTLAQVIIPESFNPTRCSGNSCSSLFATPGYLISTLLPNVIIFAGIILFFLILFYGYRMIQLADTHSPQDLSKAQNAVTYSILGFLLVVSAYFILQLIESTLGIKITTTI